jgi:hypothetical protein
VSEYERNLLQHMKQHMEYRGIKGGVKQWLLDGAEREGAHTIHEAVRRVPEWLLIRRLARILAEER